MPRSEPPRIIQRSPLLRPRREARRSHQLLLFGHVGAGRLYSIGQRRLLAAHAWLHVPGPALAEGGATRSQQEPRGLLLSPLLDASSSSQRRLQQLLLLHAGARSDG